MHPVTYHIRCVECANCAALGVDIYGDNKPCRKCHGTGYRFEAVERTLNSGEQNLITELVDAGKISEGK